MQKFRRLSRWKEEDVDFRSRTPEFEQLFNLEEDPDELQNLIFTYEGTEVLEELRAKCRDCSDDLNRQREQYKISQKVQPRDY